MDAALCRPAQQSPIIFLAYIYNEEIKVILTLKTLAIYNYCFYVSKTISEAQVNAPGQNT